MAERSFFVSVDNRTSSTMRRFSVRLYHGAWSGDAYPPEFIRPGGGAWFQAESDGFMTGTQGLVVYIAENPSLQAESLYIEFNNPYWGSNDFSTTSSHGQGSSYRLVWGDPGGVNARIYLDVTLTVAAVANIGDCNLEALWERTSVSEDVRGDAFEKMRHFRDTDFGNYPGLDPWWSEFQAAIPDLVGLVNEHDEVRTAADALLLQVPKYLSDPATTVEERDIENLRIILTRVASSDPKLSQRFAERGLRVLSVLKGRPWSEALKILSSVKPLAES